MGDKLLLLCTGFLIVMYLMYWLLVFLLTDNIFEKKRSKKRNLYGILVAVVGTGIVAALSTLERGSVYSYAAIFALLLISFYILYKDTFAAKLFCASACILHVMALRAIVTAAFSMISGNSVYEVSNDIELFILSITVAAVITNLAITGVLKFIPAEKIKIINQHKEQQFFMIAWMTVFNLYLLFNASVFCEPTYHPNLTGNELIAPLAILLGLYIVLFFAFKTATLLGYKDKNAELEQAVFQEQQYRNSAVKDAIVTYEVNVTKDRILKGFEDQRQELGGMAGRYSDMLAFMTRKTIHSEDIEGFMKYAECQNITREYESGKGETTVEYRRLLEDGKYKWVRAVTNLMRDIETGDLLAYVCVKDIDVEKRHRLELAYKAERDPLTGLYNKEITGKLINEHLAFGHDNHADSIFFMIDIDNFKTINDRLSHIFGDAVLCELADKLRSIFRNDDIVGRIGGDEFVAYMKNCASVNKVREKAEEIRKAFFVTYKGKEGEEYVISGSTGIARFPKDGHSFEDLYKASDAALYEAKRNGKNTYSFYEGGDFEGYTSNRTEIYPGGAVSQKGFRQNRVEYVFKMLYQRDDSVEAIQSVLELVASHFSFERGYIFETSEDGKTTTNTFEWCADGIKPEIENLKNVTIEAVSTANTHFNKTGTFILRSLDELQPLERAVLKPQGIKSMFQFGIFDKSRLLGFIGFDNCRSESIPSDTDIDEIATICNILATFFVKHYLDRKSESSLLLFQDVMNHLDNFIYVINMQTFEVLFMNEKTRSVMDGFDGNRPCYDFFRGNDSQCQDCPVRGLSDGSSEKSVSEIYNNRLKIWIETTATPLRWQDGTIAALINCVDISKQKEQHRMHIDQLEKLAYVDDLTGERSYNKFKEDAQRILSKKKVQRLLVKLDIDNFKLINRIYGYEKGDEILCCVAKSIRKILRNEDEIFARVTNDEFIILLTFQNMDEVTALYADFLSEFDSCIGENFSFKINFPQGRYLVTHEDTEKINVSDMFEKVNVAHKAAKMDKSLKFVIYDESITKNALYQKEIENRMDAALQNEEFVVYLQPKYYLSSEKMGGAEALVRWKCKNPEGKNGGLDLFYPDAFVPIFERNGFIVKIDLYMLKKVCGIIRSWIEDGLEPVKVSVNFSRLHLNNKHFVKELCQIVDSVGIDRGLIEIEITETVIYDNIDVLEGLLEEMHQAGFTMSMDDFGSGYSSLGMLQNLPVDVIKMDRSFFVNQKDAERSKKVVGSVIDMAAKLGIGIVAEGVEEKENIDLLRELKCDMVQGYYFAKPMPAEDFAEFMKS